MNKDPAAELWLNYFELQQIVTQADYNKIRKVFIINISENNTFKAVFPINEYEKKCV